MRGFKTWILLILMAVSLIPVAFSNSANATTFEPQVSAGSSHIVALKSDGTVVATGSNSHGQCNVGGWSDIVQVSAGRTHTVGLKSDGTVVAKGSNSSGQCNVSSWSSITQVSAGNFLTVGLAANGTAVATGLNSHGQRNVGGWSDIIQVSAGGTHTVGLKSDGTVVATGSNYWGQRNVTDWDDIVQVAASYSHTVGLKSDGTAVAVGFNDDGQCDVGGWNWKSIVQVASTGGHTAALKSDGKVVVTGSHEAGQWSVNGWSNIDQIATGYQTTLGLKKDGANVAVVISGKVDSFVWTVEPTDEQRYEAGYDAGHQVGYNQGYQAAVNQYAPIITDLQAQLQELKDTYRDTTLPTGSVHAHDNYLFPPNNMMVEITLSGYVCDELSIARDGGGIGISSAHLLVNGEGPIPLVLDGDGVFSLTEEFEARRDTVYTIELYAADTNPIEDGGPNLGLIDQTYIRVPSDRGQKGGKIKH